MYKKYWYTLFMFIFSSLHYNSLAVTLVLTYSTSIISLLKCLWFIYTLFKLTAKIFRYFSIVKCNYKINYSTQNLVYQLMAINWGIVSQVSVWF